MKPIVSILLLALSFNAHSIVIRHDVPDEQYRAQRDFFPALATFYIDGAHGTLIQPTWVLTAAHATFCLKTGSTINIGGQKTQVKSLFVHKGYQPGKSHDIALVELQASAQGVTPAATYQGDNEKGTSIWFVGIGGTGNGKTGQTIDSWDNAGVLRKAQNKVANATGAILEFIFEQGAAALPLEGVSGAGDSGGPAFTYENGQYTLIGISSRFYGGKLGGYGITEVYTRVSFFQDWIAQIIEGDSAARNKVARAKLHLLPAGLTPDNLEMVCADISLRK